jgi:hypothetical protein
MQGELLRAIPLDLIAGHERQSERNHQQTLAELARRGGLSPCEALAVIRDRPWKEDAKAEAELIRLVAERLS